MNRATSWTERPSEDWLSPFVTGAVLWYVGTTAHSPLNADHPFAGHYFSQRGVRDGAVYVHRCLYCHSSLTDRLPSRIGPEIWHVDAGRLTQKGKAAVVEDAFADSKSARGSATNTPSRSRLQTPAASVHGTPAGSGAEDQGNSGAATPPFKKKKKLTRNQIKAQEERRRVRKLNWLTFGGPKPEDTDSD